MSTVVKPTADDIRSIAKQCNLSFSDEDIAIHQELTAGTLESWSNQNYR